MVKVNSLLVTKTLFLTLLIVAATATVSIVGGGGITQATTDDDEDQEQEQEQSPQSQSSQSSQPEEQCSVGLSLLKSLIDKGTADQNTINMYNEGLRSDEIMQYINQNIDDLAIPDWMKEQDTKSGLCLVARGVAEQEQLQGTPFTGTELDDTIALQAAKVQGEAASKVLGQ